MLLRLRTPTGTQRLTVRDDATHAVLKALVLSLLDVDAPDCQLLHGFPPRPLDLKSDEPIASALSNGDILTVQLQQAQTPLSSSPALKKNNSASPTTRKTEASHSPPPSSKRDDLQYTAAEERESISAQGKFIRKPVPDDNSCLFRAVSYVMGNVDEPEALRVVVANLVGENPQLYNESFLERSNRDYQQHILKPQTWGGALELRLLASYYRVEIVAFDIITLIAYHYGEDSGYPTRVFLVYDGLHYDPIVLDLGGVEVTQFGANDNVCKAKAFKIAEDAKKNKQYTDTANFTLKCGICGAKFRGEAGATEHGKATGHARFVEV